jgi:hypothetical protein
MGRQFKFRIWDRQSKRFVGNDAGTHCASRWLIDAFTGRPVDFVVGFEDPEFGSLSEGQDYYIEGTKVIKEPQYVVQQFTGILDKDGVEIYEGDIVKFQDLTYEIINSGYQWESVCRRYQSLIMSDYSHVRMSEKIGNIFENPKLLNKNE